MIKYKNTVNNPDTLAGLFDLYAATIFELQPEKDIQENLQQLRYKASELREAINSGSSITELNAFADCVMLLLFTMKQRLFTLDEFKEVFIKKLKRLQKKSYEHKGKENNKTVPI